MCTGVWGEGGACTCGIELGVALSKTISTPSLKIPLTKINVKLKKNVKMQIFQRGKCTKRNNKVKINNTRISTEKWLGLMVERRNEVISILRWRR